MDGLDGWEHCIHTKSSSKSANPIKRVDFNDIKNYFYSVTPLLVCVFAGEDLLDMASVTLAGL